MTDKTIIEITGPEVIKKENETIFDYDESHVIYKTQDLGSFTELQKMKAMNQKQKETIDKIKEWEQNHTILVYTKNAPRKLVGTHELLHILYDKEVE